MENRKSLSPTTSVHGIMPATVGQEKAHSASSDLHLRLKNDVNAAKHIVRKGSDLLSVSPGANHPAGGSGIVVKSGGPIALNVDGDGETPNSDIHHGVLSDAVAPSHAVFVSRIDDGNEVNSMYVVAPADGINYPIDAPLSKAEVCIEISISHLLKNLDQAFFSRPPHHKSFMLSVVIWQVITNSTGPNEIIGSEAGPTNTGVSASRDVFVSSEVKGQEGRTGHNAAESSGHSAAVSSITATSSIGAMIKHSRNTQVRTILLAR